MCGTGLFQLLAALASNTVLAIRNGGCRAKVFYLAADRAITISQIRSGICRSACEHSALNDLNLQQYGLQIDRLVTVLPVRNMNDF